MPASSQPYRPAAAILEIADFIADPVAPAHFPEHRLRFRNDRAASEVGLDALTGEEWLDHFARFVPLPGSLAEPLALRYHGHQFRVYNSELGDGRGFLFGQCVDGGDRLLDFGTKGSGRTPWSRFGDGRLTLKGGVREVLASEMLEALGVPTSRSLSLVETGEELVRGDEPSPTRSAVLVRLSWSHLRIGSFQRLAHMGEHDALARLVAHVLRNYYGEPDGPDAAPRLLAHVTKRVAQLAASYVAAGFVHGVLNTDNINVTGESFDYGPWRFVPSFDPGFTAAYFDQAGLYAFGRQAEALVWNLVQLARALRPLVDDGDALAAPLEAFGPTYLDALVERLLWRLGVARTNEAEDVAVVEELERALRATQVPLDRFFFDWRGGAPRQGEYGAEFTRLRALLAPRARAPADHPYWSDAEPCSMLIDEVEAIWSPIADRDDWRLFADKVGAIRRMGAALANGALPF